MYKQKRSREGVCSLGSWARGPGVAAKGVVVVGSSQTTTLLVGGDDDQRPSQDQGPGSCRRRCVDWACQAVGASGSKKLTR